MKKFEYIEIEHSRYIHAKYQQFLEWLSTNKNDDFIDRILGNHGRFGTFKINIFVYKDKHKIELKSKKILDTINSYAERGWEVIGVRNEVLKEYPNHDFYKKDENEVIYSSQSFYTLKKYCYYPSKRRLQEIIDSNEQGLKNEKELDNDFIELLEANE